MIDGINLGDHTVLIALGIDTEGKKQVLGLREGDTENSRVAKALLRDLSGIALKEFRRLNPWFRSIPDREVAAALVLGDAAGCRAQLAEISETLDLALPVLDLSGLAPAPTTQLLEALEPGE